MQGLGYNDEFNDSKEYLERFKIVDVIQQLTLSCLIEQPGNPREFMAKKLEAIRTSRARSQNHVVFTRENLVAVFRCFDVTGKGYISLEQYKEAMETLGAKVYNQKPSGYGLDHITLDTFADEAGSALRKL
ncbi:hypothetical protein EDD86DRAFT_241515 [Gorgonomyces haynaldii]|nr:hypothetical protein EDD86DRAFT_241515 [Gorgonomyces haynaldii]